MTSTVKIFTTHMEEFLNDIIQIFPENEDLLKAKNAFTAARKANPKLLVKFWKDYIYTPYKEPIDACDVGFFIEKDYTEDIQQVAEKSQTRDLMNSINAMREPVRNMSETNQAKTMKYIQNLSKLSMMVQ